MPIVTPWADHFTCLTFDYPATGGRLPWSPLTVLAMAAAAVAVLERADHVSAHVLGISLGGMVAQEMAIRFPHRVRGLVLAATTPGGPRSAIPGHWTFLAGFSDVRGAVPPALVGVGRYALGAQTVAASLHDTSRRLRRIQAHTLVLHGDRDVLVPVANAHLLHQGIRRSTLQVVPGDGHAYFAEQSEDMAARVVRWIRDTRPGAGGSAGALTRMVKRVDRILSPQLGTLRLAHSNGVRAADWFRTCRLNRQPARGASGAPPP